VFRSRSWRWPVLLIALAVTFAIGIALGEALHDQPDLSGDQTFVRTLHSLTLVPQPTETVTVTTSSP
jgi:hypothetical protein